MLPSPIALGDSGCTKRIGQGETTCCTRRCFKTPACANAYPSQVDADMRPEPTASPTTTSILPTAGSFLDPPHHRLPPLIAASAAEGMLTRFAVYDRATVSRGGYSQRPSRYRTIAGLSGFLTLIQSRDGPDR
jgi:hypothetical protein